MGYSYARGVLNTRVTVESEGTLADLRERFKRPVVLEMSSIEYHNAPKRVRGDVKKVLPYFVGGKIKGRRHDENVEARTMITLDIEAREGQAAPPPPQDTFDALEGLGAEGWVYTSLSHTPAAPRYRVVLPLGEWIEGPDLNEEVMKATTQAAAKRLGLGPWCTSESWVLSQPMYLPAKLKDGVFWEGYTDGKQWRIVRGAPAEKTAAKDIPDGKVDPVLVALKRAGLYLQPAPRHPGMHYIRCPWHESHNTENDSKTVYYEAHYDGNPRPACKCMSTSHEELTYGKLVRWLRDEGHLTKSDENQDTASVLEDYDTFQGKASISRYLETQPGEREFAWDRFAPVGKVTVLAGPGGVSKSMLMLHLLVYGALGQSWGGFNVSGPVRGLYVSYEDDTLELHKRVHRLAEALKEQDDGLGDMLYDIKGALQRNLLLYAADEEATSWLIMSKFDQRSAPERTERVEWLIGFIKHARLKAIVIDPVVYTHNLEESSPGDMAVYMQTLNYIAKEGNCAVVVLHHMHKTAQWATLDEINQGSLRGASSFADNSRSVGVMVSMPPKDAPAFGLSSDTAPQFAFFKHVKHNYSASMGYVLFERRGPLLVPRPDIQRLSAQEVKEALEERKARDNTAVIESKAYTIIGWLLDQNGGGASTNMLRTGTNIRYSIFKDCLQYCVENELLEMEQGPNRLKYFTVSKTGAQWFAERAKERRKTDKLKEKKSE
jgi:hypothetical protein